jgi:hypothetical protein
MVLMLRAMSNLAPSVYEMGVLSRNIVHVIICDTPEGSSNRSRIVGLNDTRVIVAVFL